MLKRFPLDGTAAPEMPTTLWSWASPSALCVLKKAHGSQKNLPNPPSSVVSTGVLGEECLLSGGLSWAVSPWREGHREEPSSSGPYRQQSETLETAVRDSEPCVLATASWGDRDVMDSVTLLLLIRVRTRINLMIHVLGLG